MVEFKVVVADPRSGRSFQVVVKEEKAEAFIGRKIGDIIPGHLVGLDDGYKLKITGGTDRDGFPMRPDIQGTGRPKVLLSSGPGFRPKRKGERRRKRVRGNTIAEDIAQINTVIVEYGTTDLEQFFKKEEKQESS